MFGSVWDLKDVDDQYEVAVVSFGLAFNDDRTDGVWGEIFGSTIYFGKNELLRTVEGICQDEKLGAFDSSQQSANFLLNFAYTAYTFYLTSGEMIDKQQFLSAIRSCL